MGFASFHIASFLLVIFLGYTSCADKNIKISIYYESMCPDSRNFISDELFEIYGQFKERIELDFVPYGKASQVKSSSGTWDFTCQHGAKECKGNKYQACALNQQRGQDAEVKFVNCAMNLADPSDPDGIRTCADTNAYNWDKLYECAEGNKGGDLLAAYGDRTHSLNPKLRFVPTIILNDRFDQATQDSCLTDLAKVLCLKLSEPKPKPCSAKV